MPWCDIPKVENVLRYKRRKKKEGSVISPLVRFSKTLPA
jgi:hypothetical protein